MKTEDFLRSIKSLHADNPALMSAIEQLEKAFEEHDLAVLQKCKQEEEAILAKILERAKRLNW